MKNVEKLLVKIVEECSDIQKSTSKCLTYGLGPKCYGNSTNAEDIIIGYEKLSAVISALASKGILSEVQESTIESIRNSYLKELENEE